MFTKIPKKKHRKKTEIDHANIETKMKTHRFDLPYG